MKTRIKLEEFSKKARYPLRTQISLSENLKKVAENLSAEKDISLSELVRYLLLKEAKKARSEFEEWKTRERVNAWVDEIRDRVAGDYLIALQKAKGTFNAKDHHNLKTLNQVRSWVSSERKHSERY